MSEVPLNPNPCENQSARKRGRESAGERRREGGEGGREDRIATVPPRARTEVINSSVFREK